MVINETFIIGGDDTSSANTKTFSSIDNSIDIVLSGNNYDFSVIKTDEIISGGTIPVTNGGVFDYVASAISNVDNFYTTGVTLNNNILYFDRNDELSAYTVSLSSFTTTDNFTTGVTLSNNILYFDRKNELSAYTVSLSSFTTTDNFTTGATFANSIISFNRKNELSAYTVNLTSLNTDIPNLGNDVWKKSNLTGNTTNKTEDTYRQGSVNLVGASTFFTTGQNAAEIIAGTNGANFGHISAGGSSVIPFIQLLSNHANGSAGTNNFIGRLTGAGLGTAQMNFSAIKSGSYDSWNDSGRALFRWQDGYLSPLHKFEIGTDYLRFHNYTSSRNDSGSTVNNLLFTDANGVLKSRPIGIILSGKSDLVSPSFSGTPSAPTASSGSNTTQIATTEFVTQGLGTKLNSIQAGANIFIDDTNPLSPIINANVSGGTITGFTYNDNNSFIISLMDNSFSASFTTITGITTSGDITPTIDNDVDLGTNILRFREINTVSGNSTVWTSTNSVTTNELNLGLDLNGNLRKITADNSILVDDNLDGGIY